MDKQSTEDALLDGLQRRGVLAANDLPLNHRLIFKFIKADQFMPAYCPQVGNYKQKISGTCGGRPVEFTEADKAAIRKGLAQILTDLLTTP